MVLEQLDTLRGEFAECEFLALANIASGTVLCVSSVRKPPQEQLDSYCAAAAECLNGDMARAVSGASGDDTDAQLNTAVLLAGEGTVFFLRAAQDADEALVCKCAPDLDVDHFLHSMRSGLAKIEATP